MVFVLDNYDSFTYNLVQYLGELGAEVVVRRNDEVTIAEVDAMHPERIVVSPGPCTPQEAGISIKLMRIGMLVAVGLWSAASMSHAWMTGFVGFAFARGLLGLGEGATFPGGATATTDANGQAAVTAKANAATGPYGVTATTAEGEIMGLAHRNRRQWGVQFHPESVLTGEGKRLVENFLKH